MERPEYINCIKNNYGKAYCGRSEKWMFIDAQHAIDSIKQGSRMVPCKQCMMIIENDNKIKCDLIDYLPANVRCDKQ